MPRGKRNPDAPKKEPKNNRAYLVVTKTAWDEFCAANGLNETIGNLMAAKNHADQLADQASERGEASPAFTIVEVAGTIQTEVKKAFNRNFVTARKVGRAAGVSESPATEQESADTTESPVSEEPRRSRRH